jgi:hypothetical protein
MAGLSKALMGEISGALLSRNRQTEPQNEQLMNNPVIQKNTSFFSRMRRSLAKIKYSKKNLHSSRPIGESYRCILFRCVTRGRIMLSVITKKVSATPSPSSTSRESKCNLASYQIAGTGSQMPLVLCPRIQGCNANISHDKCAHSRLRT